jgi:hypothetical protein
MHTFRLDINTISKTIAIQKKVDNGTWHDVERLQYDPERCHPNFGPSNFQVLHGYMRDRKRIYASGLLDQLTEPIL